MLCHSVRYMVSQELSPQDVVRWFRTQAKSFQQMADTVEATFKINSVRFAPDTSLTAITADHLKEAIKEKGKQMRVATLAKQFNVENHVIKSIVQDPKSGLEIGEKGWIKEI
jgi:hypothetical protein